MASVPPVDRIALVSVKDTAAGVMTAAAGVAAAAGGVTTISAGGVGITAGVLAVAAGIAAADSAAWPAPWAFSSSAPRTSMANAEIR